MSIPVVQDIVIQTSGWFMLNYEKKTTGILILSDAKVVYSDNYVKLREFTPPKNCTACAMNL